ncbi:peptide transporter ptr2 [Neodidymelliopsis sp. IMI 364377]|nr:peptide transporter ptr2 [Neodidymelliopsis sp. IMI 364377]
MDTPEEKNLPSKNENSESIPIARSQHLNAETNHFEEPTEEDLKTCRREADKLPKMAILVAVVSLCERYAYYGFLGILQNYIQNRMDDPLRPGALGLGQDIASLMINCFTLVSQVTPLATAAIADSYLGHYKTLRTCFCMYAVGLTILLITSLPPLLRQGSGLPGLIVALIIISLGVGGVKSTLPPFLAEQCHASKTRIRTSKTGERVIVDREATVEYAFNVYYWCVNIGGQAIVASTLLEKKVGFWVAFLIFNLPPDGSVLPSAWKVIYIAVRNGFRLDAARPEKVAEDTGKTVKWGDSFIEEMKKALVAARIGVPFVVYWLCQNQLTSNTISQAANMETSGVPNDLMPDLNAITVLLCLPLATHGLYPLLRKLRISFPPVTRIALGFLLEAMAMGFAAGVQGYIYASGPCYDHPRACPASPDGTLPNRVSVAMQIPIYVFEGLGEIFSNPAMYEYAFTEAPHSMKAVLQAFFALTAAAGSALGLALTPTYRDPYLLAMYASLAGAMFVGAVGVYALLWPRRRRADSEAGS